MHSARMGLYNDSRASGGITHSSTHTTLVDLHTNTCVLVGIHSSTHSQVGLFSKTRYTVGLNSNTSTQVGLHRSAHRWDYIEIHILS
jgi:hypothetical protein